jgi:hypothetical protein
MAEARPRLSPARFAAALILAIVSAGFLFVFWLFVCNGFFGFARTTSPEGSSLLTTFALQVFPPLMLLVGTLMPGFFVFALGPTLIASLIVKVLGLRRAVPLMMVGALTGLSALVIFQLVDVAFLGARSPVISLSTGSLPALLAGGCGGLTAWVVAFGSSRRPSQ